MSGTKRTAIMVAALLGGAAACEGSGSGPAQDADSLRSLGQQRSGLETLRVYDSVEEAMPNVDYTLDGKPHYECQLYMRGEIIEIRPGRSFSWPMRDDVEDVAVIGDYNAEGADMSEVLIDVAVTDGIAATAEIAVPERLTISIGFQAPVNLDSIGQDLRVGSDIVALLNRWDTVTGTVTSTYEPLEGLFVGRVADNGRLTFPAVEGAGEDGLVPSGLTVADLESPDDQESIVLRTVDGEVVRRR